MVANQAADAEGIKPTPFAPIPAPLIRYLKPGELNVWAGLKLHDFKRDGLVWPSQTRLAEVTGLTDTSIRKLTKQMHATGVLTMTPKGQNGFRYQLHEIPADWTPNEIGPEESSGDPEETSGRTRRKFGANPEESSGDPEETSDEVDKRNTSREQDQTETEEPEVITAPRSATGVQSPTPKRSNQDGQKVETVRAEGTDNVRTPLAADDFLAEMNALMGPMQARLAGNARPPVCESQNVASLKPALGLEHRLARHREPSDLTAEELREQYQEDLAELLAKHR